MNHTLKSKERATVLSFWLVLLAVFAYPIAPAAVIADIILSAVFIAVFIVFKHRENIKRLLAGKENKFSLKKKDKFVKSEKE